MSSEPITRSEPAKLHVKHIMTCNFTGSCVRSLAKVVNFNLLTIAWHEKHVTLYQNANILHPMT